jgi:hypothetical protein
MSSIVFIIVFAVLAGSPKGDAPNKPDTVSRCTGMYLGTPLPAWHWEGRKQQVVHQEQLQPAQAG